jgi:hypothetical protein
MAVSLNAVFIVVPLLVLLGLFGLFRGVRLVRELV